MKALLFLLLVPLVLPSAFAQEIIIVNETTPCFLNQTAGIQMWENCGADEDFITFMLLPWEWITGGYFTMILVSIILLAVYMKYKKVIYPFAIGVVFLPVSFAFFPDEFMGFIVIVITLGLAAAITWMIREQVR